MSVFRSEYQEQQNKRTSLAVHGYINEINDKVPADIKDFCANYLFEEVEDFFDDSIQYDKVIIQPKKIVIEEDLNDSKYLRFPLKFKYCKDTVAFWNFSISYLRGHAEYVDFWIYDAAVSNQVMMNHQISLSDHFRVWENGILKKKIELDVCVEVNMIDDYFKIFLDGLPIEAPFRKKDTFSLSIGVEVSVYPITIVLNSQLFLE